MNFLFKPNAHVVYYKMDRTSLVIITGFTLGGVLIGALYAAIKQLDKSLICTNVEVDQTKILLKKALADLYDPAQTLSVREKMLCDLFTAGAESPVCVNPWKFTTNN